LQILALATRNEFLKKAILRFAVEHFREELRKMLGLLPADVRFQIFYFYATGKDPDCNPLMPFLIEKYLASESIQSDGS
jgi:hypothetical protein